VKAEEQAGLSVRAHDESQVIATVRLRYRLCAYLFVLGWVIILAGFTGVLYAESINEQETFFTVVLVVGSGIFASAFAVTLAIYRCPVCDRYISRFRPNKELCGNCGRKIR
jgi:CHASE2 domain-containing sensor protein